MTYSKSFKYKTSITGNTNEVECSVPLKHLSNFWRTLDMPLINCEVSLTLTWSKNCVLTDMAITVSEVDSPAINASTGVTFSIQMQNYTFQ